MVKMQIYSVIAGNLFINHAFPKFKNKLRRKIVIFAY